MSRLSSLYLRAFEVMCSQLRKHESDIVGKLTLSIAKVTFQKNSTRSFVIKLLIEKI